MTRLNKDDLVIIQYALADYIKECGKLPTRIATQYVYEAQEVMKKIDSVLTNQSQTSKQPSPQEKKPKEQSKSQHTETAESDDDEAYDIG